jgi:hypothetical protein
LWGLGKGRAERERGKWIDRKQRRININQRRFERSYGNGRLGFDCWDGGLRFDDRYGLELGELHIERRDLHR